MGFALKRSLFPHICRALHIVDPQGTTATANTHGFGNGTRRSPKHAKLSLREREGNTQKRGRALGEATKHSGKMQATHQCSTKKQQNNLKERQSERGPADVNPVSFSFYQASPTRPASPVLKPWLAVVGEADEAEGGTLPPCPFRGSEGVPRPCRYAGLFCFSDKKLIQRRVP